MAKKGKTVQVKLVKSQIGRNKRQRKTLEALGLRRVRQVVTHEDTSALRGMIDKVSHLVEVSE